MLVIARPNGFELSVGAAIDKGREVRELPRGEQGVNNGPRGSGDADENHGFGNVRHHMDVMAYGFLLLVWSFSGHVTQPRPASGIRKR